MEGNVNHVHGMEDWGVTTTLVRDNTAVLAVVYLPMSGNTYTAVRGGGAYENGVRLHASTKTEMGSALAGTSQARPGDDEEIQRLGVSVAAMTRAALVVRVSVPATSHLVRVAAGRMDVFWQHADVRLDQLAGALLVTEAGGTVSDTRGRTLGPGERRLPCHCARPPFSRRGHHVHHPLSASRNSSRTKEFA